MLRFDFYELGSYYTRKNAIRGGSCILVKKIFQSKERLDIVNESVERHVEFSCVELNKLIIISVYRPPSGIFTIFEKAMEDVLRKTFNSNKPVIVCGDFNVDILLNNADTLKIKNLFNSFNLQNVFLEPTRITATTSTGIDNIFCKVPILSKSILHQLSSDHTGQYIEIGLEQREDSKEIIFRPITEQKLAIFKERVTNKIHTNDLKSQCSGDPNKLYEVLFNKLVTEFKDVFKKKTVKCKKRQNFTSWATKGIIKSRETLYDLYEKKSYTHDAEFLSYVKRFSKVFKLVCQEAKKFHISSKIKKSANKSKAVWSVINSNVGKNKSKDNEFILENEGNIIKDASEVANVFVKFFTEIPHETTKDLSSSSDVSESLLKEHVASCPKDFVFKRVSSYKIIKCYKTIALKKTEDFFGISVKVVSAIIEDIAPYLADIFNCSIEQGIFPDLMKHSKISPLFKAGSKTQATNFRPVSILPTLSKIFEKIILQQMSEFFVENELLHARQFGFRKNYSTIDAATKLVTSIFESWEDFHDAVGIFCDLSKAFDCVDHVSLLKKLQHYGVRNKALKLIESYLGNRKQSVIINGEVSEALSVTIGVPQGSILGPFLFIVYINDLPFLVEKLADIVLYADDTSLIFKTSRKNLSCSDINLVLTNIKFWFDANNLALNSKKTKCVKFTLCRNTATTSSIAINNDKLEFEKECKFLGLTLDSKLQWGPHIDALGGRLSSAAFAVRKIRQLTDVTTARLVYYSYFHSVMSYGILLWGKAADAESIFILQKRAVRSIYNLKSRESLRERFKEYGILTMPSLYILQNILYVRKNWSNLQKYSDTHSHNTRNKNKLVCNLTRLAKVSKSFVSNSIRFYNKMPDHMLNLSEKKFKKALKSFLINKAYYSVEDFLKDKIE